MQAMTVSPPMLPKCRQHGLTYLPTVWTIRHQDRRTSCRAPKDLVHTTHTGFNVRARFGLKQAETPPKFAVTSFDVPI
jgi:hypothetical protein